MIVLEHLRKEFPNAVPLKDVNAVINDGDVISVIGPSGTGKSTLIRCINMLTPPTSGKIIVDGKDITAPDCDISKVREKMGMVFQSFNLFGHMTVIENVMFGPTRLLGKSKQEAYDRGMELLHMVGMDGKALSYPDMLSGGQKQRVAIARTLSMDPDIILFDEPTSALDPTMVGEVEAVIRQLTEMGKTMMIVTHEMRFAKEISSRVFYMDEGGVYEDGPPEQIFDHPLRPRTRQFIRRLKVLEIDVDAPTFDFLEAVTRLDQYGYKNQMSAKTVYRLQALFEELCQELILPELEEKKLKFSVEYDGETDRTTVVAAYPGPSFDPMGSENLMSLSIVKNLVESYEYGYSENANTVTIRVK